MAAAAVVTRRGLFRAMPSALTLWLAIPLGALHRVGPGSGRAVAMYAPEAGELASEGNPTEPVSLELMQMMCAHCAAYSEVGQISKRTDAIALGHAPAPTDLERLDALGATARDLFMQLCRYPASNDAERHEKATYLLAFCDGDEFEREHVEALLASMGAARAGAAGAQSS